MPAPCGITDQADGTLAGAPPLHGCHARCHVAVHTNLHSVTEKGLTCFCRSHTPAVALQPSSWCMRSSASKSRRKKVSVSVISKYGVCA